MADTGGGAAGGGAGQAGRDGPPPGLPPKGITEYEQGYFGGRCGLRLSACAAGECSRRVRRERACPLGVFTATPSLTHVS